MTREEAKRRVECCRDFLANNYSDMGEPNFTALNMAIEALSEPTKTDNMTNGDVIKAMFPFKEFNGLYNNIHKSDYVIFDLNGFYMRVSDDWWNAPYKGNFTTPTRPKAKWIRHGACNYTCSECGFPVNQKYDFCVCGAEMESE